MHHLIVGLIRAREVERAARSLVGRLRTTRYRRTAAIYSDVFMELGVTDAVMDALMAADARREAWVHGPAAAEALDLMASAMAAGVYLDSKTAVEGLERMGDADRKLLTAAHASRPRVAGRILVALEEDSGDVLREGLLTDALRVHEVPGVPTALVLGRNLEPLVQSDGTLDAQFRTRRYQASERIAVLDDGDDLRVIETAAVLLRDTDMSAVASLTAARTLV